VVAVVGATGRQGSAVVRHLLQDGWRVRALSRDPSGDASQALRASGAELHRVDAEDVASLRRAFDGAYGVLNVQNPTASSVEAEVRQGGNVADAAAGAGVQHVVYGAAGVGEDVRGVGSWDSEAAVAGGADLSLVADVQSVDQCRAIWHEVTGRVPRSYPMPVWLFERIVGSDLTTMWRWLQTAQLDMSTRTLHEILPEARTVREWLGGTLAASS
jgi:hypothetical protein